MRSWAKGLLCLEAAVELLIGHGTWLSRADFLEAAVGLCDEQGRLMACVDFAAAVSALDGGVLPGSAGEKGMLRLAAGIAEGCPVDLRGILTGLDAVNAALAAEAVSRAAGLRPRAAGASR